MLSLFLVPYLCSEIQLQLGQWSKISKNKDSVNLTTNKFGGKHGENAEQSEAKKH